MKKVGLLCCLIIAHFSMAQNRVLPIASYFKDQVFRMGTDASPVFPVENQVSNYYKYTKDSTKRYSNFGYALYNKELIELHKKEGSLWITPLLDISLGKGLADTLAKRSQNTRGARIEGALGKKVFFSTAIFENQAVFAPYIGQYVSQRGEFYPNAADSSYVLQNAVIPGAARTKPFKTEGYDYAYAVGMVRWTILPKLNVYWGNQSVFVGSGHRSMLWSDNSVPAMNLRVQYQLGEKWDFQFSKMRGFNLLRLPVATNGEAYYEPKSLSMAVIYFKPTKHTSIGLFEGGIWSRGDSLQKTPIQAAYFIPIPGGALLQEAINQKAYSLVGIDANHRFKNWMIYGQFGLNVNQSQSFVGQLGTRIFFKKASYSFVQVEFNHADKMAYAAQNPRIHYANYQLPLAHPMGGNLDELLLRFNFEWKHWFLSGQTSYYFNQSVNYKQLLPIYQVQNSATQQSFYQSLELGYRFNRSYGFDVFASFVYRNAWTSSTRMEGSWINFGLRTAINNHYYDF